MERLTHEADFGLEDWEETLFFVKSDPNGAYNIIDIAKYQGEPEFDEILKNVALRLAAYENTGLEPENVISAVDMAKVACALEELNAYKKLGSLHRLRELAEADREGRCVVLKFAPGSKVYRVWFNPRDGKFFITEHIMQSKEMCLEAELWNDAYKTREEAEKALEEMEENENG